MIARLTHNHLIIRGLHTLLNSSNTAKISVTDIIVYVDRCLCCRPWRSREFAKEGVTNEHEFKHVVPTTQILFNEMMNYGAFAMTGVDIFV